jgi:hypothetical protein
MAIVAADGRAAPVRLARAHPLETEKPNPALRARARAFPGHGYHCRGHGDDHAFCELIRFFSGLDPGKRFGDYFGGFVFE